MSWNFSTDTIAGGQPIDKLIHVSKHGISWNTTPQLNYSTNKNLAAGLYNEMKALDSSIRTYREYTSEGGVFVGEYKRGLTGKGNTLRNRDYAALISQMYLDGGYGSIYGYRKTGPFNLGEWKLNARKSRGDFSMYLNYQSDTVPVCMFYSDTITPFTEAYNRYNTVAKLKAMAGNNSRNTNLNTFLPKIRKKKEYLEKSKVVAYREDYEDKSISTDINEYSLFQNCIAYYDAYQYDALGSDLQVLQSIICDCTSSTAASSIYRPFNSWENSTPNYNNPESNYIRDMSLINLNCAKDMCTASYSVLNFMLGNGSGATTSLPVVRISSETIHEMWTGDPETCIPQLAWTLDKHQIAKAYENDTYYLNQESFVRNYIEGIHYKPYINQYSILNDNEWTLEMWFRLRNLPIGLASTQRQHLIGNFAPYTTATDSVAGFSISTMKLGGNYKYIFTIHDGDTGKVANALAYSSASSIDTLNFTYINITKTKSTTLIGIGDCAAGWRGFESDTSPPYDGMLYDFNVSNTEYPIYLGRHPKVDHGKSEIDIHKLRFHNVALDTNVAMATFAKEAPTTALPMGKGQQGINIGFFGLKNTDLKLNLVELEVTDADGSTQSVGSTIKNEADEDIVPW
tara:strand:- start:3203 stop:5083 length:1881 start_codon:yes stop_codon:yes gene_type:complete